MANSQSSAVAPADVTIASQYNNLRKDVFGAGSVAATVTYLNNLVRTIVALSVTYTITRNFRGEVASISDGTNTLTVNRNVRGFITSLS